MADDANIPEWKRKLLAMKAKGQKLPPRTPSPKTEPAVPEWKQKLNQMMSKDETSMPSSPVDEEEKREESSLPASRGTTEGGKEAEAESIASGAITDRTDPASESDRDDTWHSRTTANSLLASSPSPALEEENIPEWKKKLNQFKAKQESSNGTSETPVQQQPTTVEPSLPQEVEGQEEEEEQEEQEQQEGDNQASLPQEEEEGQEEEQEQEEVEEQEQEEEEQKQEQQEGNKQADTVGTAGEKEEKISVETDAVAPSQEEAEEQVIPDWKEKPNVVGSVAPPPPPPVPEKEAEEEIIEEEVLEEEYEEEVVEEEVVEDEKSVTGAGEEAPKAIEESEAKKDNISEPATMDVEGGEKVEHAATSDKVETSEEEQELEGNHFMETVDDPGVEEVGIDVEEEIIEEVEEDIIEEELVEENDVEEIVEDEPKVQATPLPPPPPPPPPQPSAVPPPPVQESVFTPPEKEEESVVSVPTHISIPTPEGSERQLPTSQLSKETDIATTAPPPPPPAAPTGVPPTDHPYDEESLRNTSTHPNNERPGKSHQTTLSKQQQQQEDIELQLAIEMSRREGQRTARVRSSSDAIVNQDSYFATVGSRSASSQESTMGPSNPSSTPTRFSKNASSSAASSTTAYAKTPTDVPSHNALVWAPEKSQVKAGSIPKQSNNVPLKVEEKIEVSNEVEIGRTEFQRQSSEILNEVEIGRTEFQRQSSEILPTDDRYSEQPVKKTRESLVPGPEEEEKKSNSALIILLILVFCLAIGAGIVAVLIFYTETVPRFWDGDTDVNPRTPLDPYEPGQCDFTNQVQPHVLSQCLCEGPKTISILSDNTIQRRSELIDTFVVPTVYDSWDLPLDSCDPRNQALVWLSSGEASDDLDMLQRYIMALTYIQTNGVKWIAQELWLSDSDVCLWGGVDCSVRDINAVELANNQVLGAVPSELGLLTQLQRLNFYNNVITGMIPSEFFSLPNINEIGLSRNLLTGSIPTEIGLSQTLEVFRIGGNVIKGSVVSELGNVRTLLELDLGYNRFEGLLPTEMNALTRLRWLSLEANNGITGRIPTEFGTFVDLEYFSISNTTIRARIPRQYGALTEMKEFRMANTLVGGDIPPAMGNLTKLTFMDLSGSRFRKSIPSLIGDFQELRYLGLGNNELSGTIPTELGRLTELTTLLLHGNELSTSIPVELGLLTNLETLAIEGNLLSGRMPDELCQLRSEKLESMVTDCPSRDLGVVCPIPTCCTSCTVIPESHSDIFDV